MSARHGIAALLVVALLVLGAALLVAGATVAGGVAVGAGALTAWTTVTVAGFRGLRRGEDRRSAESAGWTGTPFAPIGEGSERGRDDGWFGGDGGADGGGGGG